MIQLPDVTVVAVTTRDYAETLSSLKKTLEIITPHSVLFFTDIKIDEPGIENIQVESFKWDGYNRFLCKELWRYITTSHIMVIQWDGYPIEPAAWNDQFLEYDYIGAPWTYRDGRNVGNGGFSMRSKRLQHILATDEFITNNDVYSPEDEVICRLYRRYLETNYGIKFAPEELAHQFSYEMHAPRQRTFGFHNFFHPPFQEFVILKRTCALGDVIMMEPVMEWFHSHNYRVVLDTPVDYFNVFLHHHYPVMHINDFYQKYGDMQVRTINLDMAYEVRPKQLALKSYYEMCGITDGVIRNSKLNFGINDTTKMMNRYIVVHIDDTDMSHRNVHGVFWENVFQWLEKQNYKVFVVGNGTRDYDRRFNTRTKNMLMYLLAGADYFIGIDSGVSQVAVALNVKSMILFGSVNPDYRYANLDNVCVVHNPCPIKKDGCYHSVIGIRGTECEVDVDNPPCITHTAESIINKLKLFIK